MQHLYFLYIWMFFYFSDDDDFVLVKFLGHRTGFILFSLDHALYFSSRILTCARTSILLTILYTLNLFDHPAVDHEGVGRRADLE